VVGYELSLQCTFHEQQKVGCRSRVSNAPSLHEPQLVGYKQSLQCTLHEPHTPGCGAWASFKSMGSQVWQQWAHKLQPCRYAMCLTQAWGARLRFPRNNAWPSRSGRPSSSLTAYLFGCSVKSQHHHKAISYSWSCKLPSCSPSSAMHPGCHLYTCLHLPPVNTLLQSFPSEAGIP